VPAGTPDNTTVYDLTMRTRIATVFAVLTLLSSPTLTSAQLTTGDDDIVDRVVAIVGDSVVLLSQINEELQRLEVTQGLTIPPPGPQLDQLKGEVLDQWVNRVLVLQEAGRDTLISVDEGLIEERVTQQIETVAQQVGGQVALQQALQQDGLTLAEYRDMFRTQIREEQTQQMFLQLRLRDAPDVELSEDEMLASYQGARGQLDQRPKLVTFEQVVMKPAPSEASYDSTRAEAERLLDQLAEGADFAELATAHSDDSGTSHLGGDLGWFRRGRMVKEFEDAAFALLDGQTSGVVESQYGFHIITIERSRPGERRGRHILLMPEVTAGDLQAARETASEVLIQLNNGAPMEGLVEQYGDPESPDSLTVTMEQISNLPPGYNVLAGASAGDVIGPLEYATGQGETRFAVINVTDVREAGSYTFEDIRGQLADQLQQQKKIARILGDLRARTYIEIRE
jgi:peptidyl-prolyl cis-trans isomerase SurA